MIINKDLCTKCGICVSECINKAIGVDDSGDYLIDQALCNNCKELYEIECIRVCNTNAITHEDGTIPEINREWRILSGHVPWMIAIMGDRGKSGFFPIDNREYRMFRKLISDAFTNPDLLIRIVYGNDDMCVTCAKKQEGCREPEGGAVFKRLEIKPGTLMKFWDLIGLVEDKFSIPFLNEFFRPAYHTDEFNDNFVESICRFVSPDAKMLTNKD